MRSQLLQHVTNGLTSGFRKYFWLSALIYLPYAQPAFADEVQPGFDCKKATTATEKLICQDLDLRWADHTLAIGYKFRLKELAPESRQVLVRDQKEWLAKRTKACIAAGGTHEETYCLLGFYQKRNRMFAPKFWQEPSLSPNELAAKLEAYDLQPNRGLCPVSRDFDLEYYEQMAADQRNYGNPIFTEIPQGLKVEEVKADYRLIDVTPDRIVPSDRVPVFNHLNPHHGLGDSRIKIYCRVQDSAGVWWLAHEVSDGTLTYFLSSEMTLVPTK